MEALIQNIISLEWELFNQSHSQDSVCPCQDNKKIFTTTRTSQLTAWTLEMQESYYQDLQEAKNEGRNPIREKYGYMMERTNPIKYAEIKDLLPKRTFEKIYLADWISEAYALWQESLAHKYPCLIAREQPIRKDKDSPKITSFETFLWGELSTYSVRTLRLYAAYVERLQKENRNMCQIIFENIVVQAGYKSLDAVELLLHAK